MKPISDKVPVSREATSSLLSLASPVAAGVLPAAILMAAQHFDVIEGFGDAFSGQPVERPGDEVIELPAAGGCEHSLELPRSERLPVTCWPPTSGRRSRRWEPNLNATCGKTKKNPGRVSSFRAMAIYEQNISAPSCVA